VLDAADQPFWRCRPDITKRSRRQIGFLAIVTPEPIMSSAGPTVHLRPGRPPVRRPPAALGKPGANVVIALTHLNFEEDRALSRRGSRNRRHPGGHDHDPITFYEHGVLLHKSGSDARFLGASI